MSRRRPRVSLAAARGRGAALAALAAATVVAGCASSPADRHEQKIVRGHAMSPYVVHEECFRAEAGERIEYYFTSDFPIDFNIHYHEGSTVIMPIVRDKVREDSALFTARIPQDYCLMWEAGPTGATIDYGLRLRPPISP